MKIYSYGDDTGPVPTDGMTEPAGKMDGQFPVRYYLVSKNSFKVYREIRQQFIDGYNVQMRSYFEHPEWFDKNGLRIPMYELHSHTNTLGTH